MFDRFIRLAKARKALQEGRYEEAAQLADDPLIRADRRSDEVRRLAQQKLADRGRQRLRVGDAAAARLDLERALAIGAHAEAAADLDQARAAVDAMAGRRLTGRQALDDARRQAERGGLDAAIALVRPVAADDELAPAVKSLETFIATRRAEAVRLIERAHDRLRAGDVDRAVEAFRSARALDDAAGSALDRRLADAAAQLLAEQVGALLAAGDVVAAADVWRRRAQILPEVGSIATAVSAGERIATAGIDALRRAERPEAEVAVLRCACDGAVLPGDGARFAALAEALLRLVSLRTRGPVAELVTTLQQVGEQLSHRGFAAEASDLARRLEDAATDLVAARAAAATGDLTTARQRLVTLIEELPMHEEARGELDAIDQGVRDRQERLESARSAARAGRLREAYSLAVAHARPGNDGEEARLFVKDLLARIDLVGRGVDQVRAALHGRVSGAEAGLRHCLSRLDELAKVQSDHEEIPRLKQSIEAEIGGIARLREVADALATDRFADVANGLAEIVRLRGSLLAIDRLDARLLELCDQIAMRADAALAAGRLGEVESCCAAIEAMTDMRDENGEIVARLRAAVREQGQRAESLLVEATDLLRARDLTGAEQRCEAARQLWADAPAARRIEEHLQSIRIQEAALVRVAELKDGGNVAAAQASLDALPPTPPLLRTRIFDLKQSLAKAQGLEGAYLLRVDEGGEFVVLRGETTTIGNLRDGRADLPILAAISSCHARIERSMSFHGGMQDTVVAVDGEISVGGRRVDRHRLRSGDRVMLGTTLPLIYSVPSTRSLTAVLQLGGGFQIAGTDRVLLQKDRGRDGRVLLGTAQDAHVRVGSGTGEVEIFANRTGQLCVRCDSGGDIDGRPFKDEHPVPAGATVRAAGITLVLLPWNRRR